MYYEKFYKYIQNGLNIPINLIDIFKVDEDYNNYYKCLSKFLYGKIDYYNSLKTTVSKFCKDNINEINDFKNEVEIKEGIFINTKEYINNMDKNECWDKDIEITISSYIFGINIAIYKYSNDKNNLEYINSYILDNNNLDSPLMTLIKLNLNIFCLIYPKVEKKEKNDDKNNEKSTEIKNDDNKEINKDKEIIQNNKEESSKNIIKEKKDLIPNDINNNNENKTSCEGENDNIKKKNGAIVNPYPKYTNYKDEDLYINIFIFLNNGLKNGKRTWPDYIENIKDKQLRDHNKLEINRKVGILKVSNTRLLMFEKMREKLKDNNDKENQNEKFNERDLYNNQERYIVENDRLYIIRY